VERLRAYKPPEATRVYARDGSRIADLSPERRVVVELTEVPKTVWNGFVAVEDKRFFDHSGIDYRGVGRAVVRNLRSMSIEEGFSTIPMQLARQVFTDELPMDQNKVKRKMCEISLAPKIEKAFTKREILKMYVNQIYLGDGLYGVEEASRAYFGKPVRKVSVGEAAILVGLAKNPEGYNPRKKPAQTIRRRNVVLDVMAAQNVITAAEANKAKAEPLRLAPPVEAAGPAPYFIAHVREELRERFGDDADKRGLRVFTGLDPAAQKGARDALVAQIRKIEKGEFGKYKHPVPDSAMKAATGGGSPYLQGMVVALDIHTGEVRALVGGRDFTHSNYDRATQAKRQPGSAFKPFVYAAAIQQGLTLSSRIETTPVGEADGAGAWRPDDLVNDTVTSLSIRDAFALSSNYGAIRIGNWVGPQAVIAMARAAGITTHIPPYPSIYLGAAEVIPIEFVAAIGAFGNNGMRIKPRFISRVEDARGKVLWRARESNEYTINPGVAFLTLSIMQDVVDRGTAGSIRRAGFWLPAAGKTGTTNDSKDVWFVGMTPDMVAGVWLGFDQPKTITPTAGGGRMAAPVWAEMMKAAYAKRPQPTGWSAPADIVSIPIDYKTGALATENCPPEDVRIEYFTPGTEPTEYCPLHGGGGNAIDKLLQGLRKVF
jgi:penicillin-binding protein 1A